MTTLIICILSFIGGAFASPFVKLNYKIGWMIGFCAGSIKTVDALRKRGIDAKKKEGE